MQFFHFKFIYVFNSAIHCSLKSIDQNKNLTIKSPVNYSLHNQMKNKPNRFSQFQRDKEAIK